LQNVSIPNKFIPIKELLSKNCFSSDSLNFINSVDKEDYYQFGDHLKNLLSEGKPTEQLKLLAHEYLNLFRFPSLLKNIYREKKWEILIHDLVFTSNYNVRTLFYQRLRDYKSKTLFNVLKGSSAIEFNWKTTANLVNSYERALIQLLLSEKSIKGKVAFLLENSLEMALLDISCLTNGIVNVMIPAASVPEHVKFILNQTEAPVLFVHNEKQLSKIKSIKNELNYLKKTILLKDASTEDWIISFTDFINNGKEVDDSHLDDLRNEVKMDSIATLMYTSGTTGEPKGIMFSQMNIVYKRFCRAMAIPELGESDRFLSYLPLFHTFGRFLEMMGAIFWAAEYCFMENPAVETVLSNMQLVKPSVFISIPKKWIQLYEYVTNKVDIELDEHEKIQSVIKEATGSNLKWGLSAAGYLPPDIFQFFQSYGIELMSGFGMTEATGGITMTPPGMYKPNSLGRALPGIDIKLDQDGEILIKGPYVMIGYYGKDNSETFRDNEWLPTGDLMKMDEDGFIEIVDRKKEIYKNVKGETIAPQKIENFFRDFESIKQVFLVGDHRPFNTVLIYPEYELENSPLENMNEQQRQEYFSSVIVTVNKFLSAFERILDFRIINRSFSDDHGELTPKGTFKRRIIEKNFDEIIEEMYTKTHTSVYVQNKEIRIPNWFLREKGYLSRDIFAEDNRISIPKKNLVLHINQLDNQNIFRIGSFNYNISGRYIDFQQLITDPTLWAGNKELTDFTGKSITQWYRHIGETSLNTFSSIAHREELSEEEKQQFIKINRTDEISLIGIHLAYQHILSNDQDMFNKAIGYFENILEDETNTFFHLTLQLAARPGITKKPDARRQLFKACIKRANNYQYREMLLIFAQEKDFLNTDLINSMVESSRGTDDLLIVEELIKKESASLSNKNNIDETILPSLFELAASYGIRHPASFRAIRRFFMKYAVLSENMELKSLSELKLGKLQDGFRKFLGTNQEVAIDQETGQEYRWDDVLTFEEGVDAEDRLRIKNAITKKPVLREAIFLFSNGINLRLDNILPAGIWISLLESKNEKSIYRLTVQTRFQGGFDVTFHLNKNLPPAIVKEEIKWLIVAGASPKGDRLLPNFGGYWEEYDLWTEAFVPRASVARFLERSIKRKDESQEQRLYYLWPYFVWNASAAYMSFWGLTNYTIELANPLPNNITIPTHDYQTGTLLYSVSKRIESKSAVTFFGNFFGLFIKKVVDEYSFLDKKSIWNYVFSGIIEAEGETKGIEIISKFKEELSSSNKFDDKDVIINRADSFIKSLNEIGFIPKSLFFAIKRFHRWYNLNKYADLNAQAQMLYELYETYQLFDLENEHPATRTQFFLQTAFKNSSSEFKKALNEIVKKQHSNENAKYEPQTLYSELHTQFRLYKEEEFFLTRLSYPHLKPTDSAELLKVEGATAAATNLVVQLIDEEGLPFVIRNPISPKEISRLHRLYLESNLTVNFRPEHQFLVALSERGFIIGGLYYIRTDGQTAHMEKIVVSNRYRRKGISEGLMNELFNRLRSEHYNFVTTGFFRPEYFYRFGFKIEKKYSGLVKNLAQLNGVNGEQNIPS
jgi:long-subunit acyl-CoA synthetase (AMP-forming)/GNAT superfamily N-acetyltransferase